VLLFLSLPAATCSASQTSPETMAAGSNPGPAAAPPPAFQTAPPDAHTLPASSLSPAPAALLHSLLSSLCSAAPACSQNIQSTHWSPHESVPQSARPPRYRSARCTAPATSAS